MVRYGMIVHYCLYDMVWYGMVWYDRLCHGVNGVDGVDALYKAAEMPWSPPHLKRAVFHPGLEERPSERVLHS